MITCVALTLVAGVWCLHFDSLLPAAQQFINFIITSNNLLQFDNDPHTTNYLETIEQLHSQTIDGDILHEIIDIKHMNYYFAQQGLRCYQVNPSPFSHLINNVIAEVLMEKPEVLQRIRQHIQPELEIYNKLIAYDTRQTRYETEENLDETDYFNQLKNLVGF